MTGTVQDQAIAARRRTSGWIESACFVVALTVLNVAYAAAHAAGAHPVVFITYAMLIAAHALLALAGPGPDWRAVVRHPLSWVIGFGIIGMETAYFMLLRYVTPADGSILIRLNVPFSLLAGWLLLGRIVTGPAVAGMALVVVAVTWFIGGLDGSVQVAAMSFALACALISVTRNFSAEYHPHNRAARTVWEKMRLTGLVLLVTSIAGALLVATLVALTAIDVLPELPGVPPSEAFQHEPTIVLAAVMGLAVLPAMQYFGFSAVVKIGTENFIAANSFVPLTTLGAQMVLAAVGLLPMVTPDWRFFAAMTAIIVGVMVFISAAGRQE